MRLPHHGIGHREGGAGMAPIPAGVALPFPGLRLGVVPMPNIRVEQRDGRCFDSLLVDHGGHVSRPTDHMRAFRLSMTVVVVRSCLLERQRTVAPTLSLRRERPE